MNPKHHTSLKIAKQLAEAGIVIESDYVWCHGDLIPVINVILETAGSEIYPAPIATEILERLPKQVEINGEMCWLQATLAGQNPTVYYGKDSGHALLWKDDMYSEYAPTLPNALALLLIRITKDGLI